jgi:hypothetical protein
MRYLKLYEDFSSEKNMAAFNDILWDKDNKDNPEMSRIMDEIEDPESEDGEMWSDSERKRLDDFLSDIDMPNWNTGDPIEKKITELSNDFKASISRANTIIDSVKKSMDSDDYKPTDIPSSKELEEKIEELEAYLDEMDSIDGWWTDIRDKLEDNPSLGLEAKNLIDLVDSTCKEIERLQRESNYTYRGFK